MDNKTDLAAFRFVCLRRLDHGKETIALEYDLGQIYEKLEINMRKAINGLTITPTVFHDPGFNNKMQEAIKAKQTRFKKKLTEAQVLECINESASHETPLNRYLVSDVILCLEKAFRWLLDEYKKDTVKLA